MTLPKWWPVIPILLMLGVLWYEHFGAAQVSHAVQERRKKPRKPVAPTPEPAAPVAAKEPPAPLPPFDETPPAPEPPSLTLEDSGQAAA